MLRPAGDAALAAAVREARRDGLPLRAVGAGHSFSDVAVCDGGVRLDLRDHARVLHVDRERGRVTVESGIRLHVLNHALDALGLALPNLGDIAYQSVAGAISTATHGTGRAFGTLSTQVAGLRLVDGRGEVVDLDAEREPELLRAARVSLGALGVITQVTLQCVPAFRLRAREGAERLDALLPRLEEEVAGNDHFEFFWVPHTGWALTKRNQRTADRPRPRPRWRELRDDVLYANVLFGAACRAGALFPERIPRLVRAVPGTPPVEYVDRSFRVFASPRLVRFVEMEVAVPREAAADVLRRIRAWLRESGTNVMFPVEVRFVAADDSPLSPAFGRETAYLAVHVHARRGPGVWEPYFRAVQAIADDVGGRPHWGKLHFLDAAALAPRYPAWDAFQKARDRLDPDRVFTTPGIARVLGP